MRSFRIPSTAALAVAAAALALAAPAARAQMVTNGDFETGSFSGWTVSGATGFTGVDALSAHGGGFGAYFGESSPGSSISQAIATTPGASYRVTFWLDLQDSAQPNGFSWTWGGVTQALNLSNSSRFDYTGFVAIVSASSASTMLRFSFTNPNSYWLLDDVVVTPVPEPAVWALALLGAAALGLRQARSRPGQG